VLLLHWKYTKTCFSSTTKSSAPIPGKIKICLLGFIRNKCSKFLIIFLSKVCCKKTWVMQKYNLKNGQKMSKVKKKEKKDEK